MESTDDDESDLKLVKASASLLADLEAALPKILWKPSLSGSKAKVHQYVKQRHLDYVIGLIEPFQGDPQLLDARLKHILPPIVEAYLVYMQGSTPSRRSEHNNLQSAVCTLLYTLCKVRGYKVVLGFLSNEPRYLVPVLSQLENIQSEGQDEPRWEVSYVLLLWLSHLLLTPFDLVSISQEQDSSTICVEDNVVQVSSIASRISSQGLHYLSNVTKSQDAATILLVRLLTRPDLRNTPLAVDLVTNALQDLGHKQEDVTVHGYQQLGSLRLLSRIAASPELADLVPRIFETCVECVNNENSFVVANAVSKKLLIKIFRNVAVLALRSPSRNSSLRNLLESSSMLETVIDHLLQSLGDRDTPVRFAAAKAISLIILDLEQGMREEVVQAVLDTFKEDMPQHGQTSDFRTANALKWHGLTLCLAHTLFKRSASPDQLPDIVRALTSALQFEQRTATGSSIGTNVRDAANFGIWSLGRRYTTQELLLVDSSDLGEVTHRRSVIQYMATQLILSACLDPAGNIRRGSSAALQELIGRHPDEIVQGIALVQTVDYLAVGLRRRAMIDVALRTTELDEIYFQPIKQALLGWRGLGSADVPSREAAAALLAKLSTQHQVSNNDVIATVMRQAAAVDQYNLESLHGFVSSTALIFEHARRLEHGSPMQQSALQTLMDDFANLLAVLERSTKDFSSRLVRSELPAATAKLISEYCAYSLRVPVAESSKIGNAQETQGFHLATLEILTERLLARHEETIREAVPPLAQNLLKLKREAGQPLGCLGVKTLTTKVALDSSKSTLNGAGRAIALGSLAPHYADGLQGAKALVSVTLLASLTNEAMNVDWRIVRLRSLQIAVEAVAKGDAIEAAVLDILIAAAHHGLNDYTIDQRGDVGSLVRLQAIACTSSIFAKLAGGVPQERFQVLHADIMRLALEKLDKVRLAAAQCRETYISSGIGAPDVASVSSYQYFVGSLESFASVNAADWQLTAILTGIVSSAGTSAEQLLQTSRLALAHSLVHIPLEQLCRLLTLFNNILTTLVSSASNSIASALHLLAYLLDMRIPQHLVSISSIVPFKWLNLLSAVQKSHQKSNDIPKIAAAVHVYRGLVEVGVIRREVLKKLLSMLKTNPYPKIRGLVAEALWAVTHEGILKERDWGGDRRGNEDAMKKLEKTYVEMQQ